MNKSLQHPEELKHYIREVVDFPKPGIVFYDLTTLLKNADALRFSVDVLAKHYAHHTIDHILAIEARGFIFGAILAYLLNVGFIPVRKPQKLPAAKISTTYNLEYGQATVEIHQDAFKPGERILIIDDLLATGGTSIAVAKMIETMGANIVGLGFVVELGFLHGRKKLMEYDVHSLVKY